MAGWQRRTIIILVTMLCLTMTLLFKEASANTANSGFISIDCGVDKDYVDEETEIAYKSDTDFISTGENGAIQESKQVGILDKQATNLRYFPTGKKNCYALRPEQGRNHSYYIRAIFRYGNYDGENAPPEFDLYIGVNFWVKVQRSSDWFFHSLIHFSSSDIIHVCLVNTGSGNPFISSLELRPLSDSIYNNSNRSFRISRWQLTDSSSAGRLIKYKDDVYDRMWQMIHLTGTILVNAPSNIQFKNSSDDPFKLPIEVLRTPIQPQQQSGINSLSNSQTCGFCPTCSSCETYICFHFADTQRRELIIRINDRNEENFTLESLTSVTKCYEIEGDFTFFINSTANSDLPPILNALEILNPLQLLYLPTDQADVGTVMAIKQSFEINDDDWQGDPCVPKNFSWNDLGCTYERTIPKINRLVLSSKKLAGDIAALELSNLTALQFLNLSYNRFSGAVPDFLEKLTDLTTLDLSSNELTGPVPEFLAQLPKLFILNLSGNKLSGSIPLSLLEKSNNGLLELRLDKNPNLCQTDSCGKKKQLLLPIIASIISFLVLLLLCIIAISWRKRRRPESQKSKDRSFSYSEIVSITDNFKTIIGGGGFGKVYLGTFKDGTQAAVKLISQSSKQGYKEFQAEVQHLLVVHHRNLVSLIGYCDEQPSMALIYEYMSSGNLQEILSETSGRTLTWKERLQIAVDTAYGLEYLHNGCRPPIIHRDLKTSNILLNEKLQAKISDFGLSRAFANESGTHITTCPAGTFGYMDPEAQASGNFNKKSDVYSFGIIILELITGQPAIVRDSDGDFICIHQWVKPVIETGDIQNIVDSRLDGEFDPHSAWQAVEIAFSCLPNSAIQRPDMSHVLSELQECLATASASQVSQKKSSTSVIISHMELETNDMFPSAR